MKWLKGRQEQGLEKGEMIALETNESNQMYFYFFFFQTPKKLLFSLGLDRFEKITEDPASLILLPVD